MQFVDVDVVPVTLFPMALEMGIIRPQIGRVTKTDQQLDGEQEWPGQSKDDDGNSDPEHSCDH
ncbi:hypothetical protein [Pontibaca salina]|uniref:Uncharacterized protein n=1 Tax=Pontibaca salina TaxID=2795731 RepID=A0A934HMN0_9RHOB|nr:hypothetical protein [Pontibaca salina]MBI6630888.1 hypothetical protein [Pontibaca salina]